MLVRTLLWRSIWIARRLSRLLSWIVMRHEDVSQRHKLLRHARTTLTSPTIGIDGDDGNCGMARYAHLGVAMLIYLGQHMRQSRKHSSAFIKAAQHKDWQLGVIEAQLAKQAANRNMARIIQRRNSYQGQCCWIGIGHLMPQVQHDAL